MKFSIHLMTVIMCLTEISASRILAIIPSPSYSHQVAFRPIWREFLLKGHQVTLVTADPINDKKLTNLTEIDVHYSYEIVSDLPHVLHESSPITVMRYFQKKTSEIARKQLSDENVRKLVQNKTLFDVVIVEAFFPEFLMFAELYKCPKILISSMDPKITIHGFMGNPTHPSLFSEPVLPFSGELSFVERLISTTYYLFVTYQSKYVEIPERDRILREHFGNSVPSFTDLVSDVDMLFINVNPIMNDVRPLGPATITFEGMSLTPPPKPLPKDLKQFLDNATNGFIFLSLGSNMQSKHLGEEKINVILEVIREIPYQVLWKFESDDLTEIPDNAKIIKWAPQLDVLRHSNIKLFITQGGIQSIEEAILNHVPMVVLPVFGDQAKNARRISSEGIAKTVFHKHALVKKELKGAILEVIQKPEYKQKVKEVAQLILDQPMTGVEKVVWWTEYVVRNKGAKHLRSPLIDIPFYKFIFLDVVAFYVFLLALITIVFVKSIQLLKKCLNVSKAIVSNEKKNE
ncbi:UDP-glycosyltransferase UGT5-like [Leptinotarsa decemlineata]|uniref:UDP-glycosyltransferase UGT5-like n=1 Tax=Leptinotarsa decemlineata TaxID=7539 RepID=UPI003D307C61